MTILDLSPGLIQKCSRPLRINKCKRNKFAQLLRSKFLSNKLRKFIKNGNQKALPEMALYQSKVHYVQQFN